MFQGRRRSVIKIEYPDNIVFREEPEGGILFDVNTGRLKLVEGVAWGICDLIDRCRSRDSILEKLRKLYPEEESIEEDLDTFLDELVESGFLRRYQDS